MESGKKIMGGAIMALFVAACGDGEKAEIVSLTSEQVQAVNDGFMMDNKPAVDIFIGPNDLNFVEISLIQANVKSGYKVDDRNNSVANFSITANWKGEHYVQSAPPCNLCNVSSSFAVCFGGSHRFFSDTSIDGIRAVFGHSPIDDKDTGATVGGAILEKPKV
ncbi:hypothetical protein [Pseudomonas zeae]|uniref:hypothetical protein n=1 Tax=Pseudomonas zeae TaxID=2745510 RepID=UPI0039DF2C80